MDQNERQNVIKKAIEALKQGDIILYPTDTIWGIGCDATNERAIERIYEIKKRPQDKKMIVLFSSLEMIYEYFDASIDLNFIKNTKTPTTFIISYPSQLPIELYSRMGIGVRIPRSAWLLELINEFGKPIISTSANISGDISPKDYYEITNEIKSLVDYRIPEIFDDGTHRPSQIFEYQMGKLKKVR